MSLKISDEQVMKVLDQHFPMFPEIIREMWGEDKEFTEASEDFVLCLREMEQLDSQTGAMYLKYAEARDELKDEILDMLRKQKGS